MGLNKEESLELETVPTETDLSGQVILTLTNVA